MRHIVITRINFDDNSLFQKYLEVMKETYVPSIKSQTNKNFEIAFIIKKEHIPILKNLFDNEKITYFNSFEQVKKYCLENNIELQTRHDCDDWMSKDYIAKIQEVYNDKIKNHDKFIIHSKVSKLNFYTNELHDHGINYKNGGFISMFLTLCQKKADRFVYDENHRFMNKITKNVFLIDGGYTRLVIHNNNIFSHITNKDKKIQDIVKYDLTLVVPTYDALEYINEGLTSMINAKSNYLVEILVGIDACEKTKNFILKNYKEFKDDIKFYFFDNNVGPYVIRNSLAQIANSDKILFVDSDDILHKEIVDETIKSLKNNDIVRFKFYNFKVSSELKQFNKNNINSFYSIGQLGIHKNKFLEMNGFEPWVCSADSEFNHRTLGNKFKVFNSNKILYYRRRHDNSLTSNTKTNWNSRIRKEYNRIIQKRVRDKNFNKLKELPVTKFYKIKENGTLELFNKKDNLYLFPLENRIKLDLSIIIPTYKNVDYLKECINSILKSTIDYEVEILIGVDGCQDSLKYLQDSQYPTHVKMFYFEENKGPYTIKNSLAEISTTNNILFFDADDIMNQNMVEEIINGLKNYICVKPKFNEFGGKSLGGTRFGEGVFGIRKSLFMSMNGFEPWMMAADSDFMGRLYKKGLKILHTPQVLFKRRVHPDSLTNRKDTGLRSIERARYAKISKNKRGDGNPKILHKRSYVVIDSQTTKNLSKIRQEEIENRKRLINLVLKPQPRKVVRKNTKKGPIVTNDNRLDFLTKTKNNKEKKIHNNQPENRQDLINKKKSQITKTIRDHFPKKQNNREGKNMINIGGKRSI